MKKTLVALAVLAASGASFAQVTLTGELTWGYSAQSALGSDHSGFGVDTSELFFDTTEDLGGGNKVTAHMEMGGLDRSGEGYYNATYAPVYGRDAYITIGGASMGTLKVGSTRGADYLGGGSSAAIVGWQVGYDNAVFSPRTTSDNLTYSIPVGPVTLAVGHREAVYESAGAGSGLGVGETGSGALGQRKNWVTVKGVFGALTFDANYSVYDNKSVTSTGVDDNSLYAAANYNFGVAKVGFGFENRKKTLGTVNDYYLSATTTFGSFDLGADYASRKYSDDFAVSGTKSGWGIAGIYHLSKRTNFIVRTQNWEPSVSPANRSTRTDLYIDHNF